MSPARCILQASSRFGATMPFNLPVGHKFSCFALEAVGLDIRGRDPLDLGDGMWVVFDTPFDLARHWEEWLGELETNRLRRCNLGLVATLASANPSVLDAENEMLTQRVLSLHYSLFMVEIFRYQGGLGLSGANVDGQVEVRQVRQMEPHYSPDRFASVSLTRDDFLRMGRVAEGIRAVHIPGAMILCGHKASVGVRP
jgi:hypothetical protein